MILIKKPRDLAGGLFLLAGAIVFALTRSNMKTADPGQVDYGKWIAIILMIAGMIFFSLKPKNKPEP